MKKKFTIGFVLILLVFQVSLLSDIKSYKSVSFCLNIKNDEFYVLRSFYEKDMKKYLVVDTNSLKTSIINEKKIKKVKCSNSSKYKKMLSKASKKPYPLINDGITHFRYGLYLTTDLCPSSKKGYEREFYKFLVDSFVNPVPITIFITKRWILKHKKEFKELKRWQESGELDITWGNHTAYHFYKKGIPYRQNFVLNHHEHLKDDVLELEKYLLENGVIPSVFFRFPGLISNKKVIKSIKSLGLITIGSDAWIAKNEYPKEGSIILVHGNKNEHRGIAKLLKIFKQKRLKELYPLYEGIE